MAIYQQRAWLTFSADSQEQAEDLAERALRRAGEEARREVSASSDELRVQAEYVPATLSAEGEVERVSS